MRAQRQCLSEFSQDMKNYIKENNRQITKELEREDYWDITFIELANTKTYKLTVWKVISTAVYLKLFIPSAGTELAKNYYIKLTTAQNTEILNQILADKCSKKYSVDIGRDTINVFKDGQRIKVSTTSEEETDVTYRFKALFPAFIANYDNTLIQRTYKPDADTASSTVRYEYRPGKRGTEDLPDDYKEGLTNIQYCIPIPNTDTSNYDLFYSWDCTNSDIAGPAGFDPSTEL